MTEADILRFATGLPGVAVMTADEASGAPEAAWGDSFIFYDPDDDEADRRMPFATIVVSDYHGFDEASDLDRPSVFRLNVAVGRDRFQELLGYPPAEHAAHSDSVDYAALHTLIPHPVYAQQSWVSILCPGDEAHALIADGHRRAAERHGR